eukprot:Hpha_TRINITY_DN12075_c0_g1::TRINITY_DN12075_c0_g1_i1::g.141260::m.141260
MNAILPHCIRRAGSGGGTGRQTSNKGIRTKVHTRRVCFCFGRGWGIRERITLGLDHPWGVIRPLQVIVDVICCGGWFRGPAEQVVVVIDRRCGCLRCRRRPSEKVVIVVNCGSRLRRSWTSEKIVVVVERHSWLRRGFGCWRPSEQVIVVIHSGLGCCLRSWLRPPSDTKTLGVEFPVATAQLADLGLCREELSVGRRRQSPGVGLERARLGATDKVSVFEGHQNLLPFLCVIDFAVLLKIVFIEEPRGHHVERHVLLRETPVVLVESDCLQETTQRIRVVDLLRGRHFLCKAGKDNGPFPVLLRLSLLALCPLRLRRRQREGLDGGDKVRLDGVLDSLENRRTMLVIFHTHQLQGLVVNQTTSHGLERDALLVQEGVVLREFDLHQEFPQVGSLVAVGHQGRECRLHCNDVSVRRILLLAKGLPLPLLLRLQGLQLSVARPLRLGLLGDSRGIQVEVQSRHVGRVDVLILRLVVLLHE